MPDSQAHPPAGRLVGPRRTEDGRRPLLRHPSAGHPSGRQGLAEIIELPVAARTGHDPRQLAARIVCHLLQALSDLPETDWF